MEERAPIAAGEPQVRFDRAGIVAAGHSPITPVVLDNPEARVELG